MENLPNDIESREDQIKRLAEQAASMRVALENMKSRQFWEQNLKVPVQNLEDALNELEAEIETIKQS